MFDRLIVITPLGLLYGSSGSFLSPDNLVGRSGNRFPPSSATVSGLFASIPDLNIENLRIAGPFWAKNDNPENFFVPTPFSILATKPFAKIQDVLTNTKDDPGRIEYRLVWDAKKEAWVDPKHDHIMGKFDKESWLPIEEWENPTTVYQSPWQYLPHLHPRLQPEERRVQENKDQGSLFLENAVQVDPDVSLIYLTNLALPDGWYRFGGEGHIVDVQCMPIKNTKLQNLLQQPVNKHFALITPGVWGSNRLSLRYPESTQWQQEALLTDRPTTFRYRFGGQGKTKRLSRGRYAVPAGTVYLLKEAIEKPWFNWDQAWFPMEGYSLQRWGCGLALPLSLIN